MPSLMSDADRAAFARDGYFIVRGMFDGAEVALLRRAMEEDKEVAGHTIDRLDASGAATRIALWNRAGSSVYGMAARCARMVDTMEALLGGAWEWHQDYGYWYYNGCLFPHLASCQIALDRSGVDNGCLEMVRGSHLLGRIDHVPVPGEGQNVADPQRMAAIVARLEVVPCELEPGDAVFFHGNTLHRSAQNMSQFRRWTLICCYNRVDNDTLVRDDDRYFVPLEKVPDSAVLAAGVRFASGDEHFATRAFVPKVG